MCGLCEGFADYEEGGPLSPDERLTLHEHILLTDYSPQTWAALEPAPDSDARGPHLIRRTTTSPDPRVPT